MQDIHTHLYWESFDTDREEVLVRAKAAGITEMLVVGTTSEESKKAIELAAQHPNLFATVGIHPNEARGAHKEQEISKWIEEGQRLLNENNTVVAIGECGLDYSESHGAITEEEKQNQKKLFEAQIDLAKKYNLPLIIHCRATSSQADEAYWDLLSLVKEHAPNIPDSILHCYMGSVSVTKEFLHIPNIFFSFTGNITYPTKKELQGGEYDLSEIVKTVPLEKIFAETDCPFLAPQEYRGQRNEPAYVTAVAKKIAEIKNVSLEQVAQKTSENFQKVFLLNKN